MICYEAIFPQDLHWSGQRPDWLVQSPTTRLVRHGVRTLSASRPARIRAIEQGLPLARAKYRDLGDDRRAGRIVASLGLGQQGTMSTRRFRPPAAAALCPVGRPALAMIAIAVILD